MMQKYHAQSFQYMLQYQIETGERFRQMPLTLRAMFTKIKRACIVRPTVAYE